MLNAQDWEYKNEGIGNIILSYIGTDAQYMGKVLRVRKCVDFEQEVFDDKQSFVHLFMKHVMQRILGEHFVHAGVCFAIYNFF